MNARTASFQGGSMKSRRFALVVVFLAIFAVGALLSARATVSPRAASPAGAQTFLLISCEFNAKLAVFQLIGGIPTQVPLSPFTVPNSQVTTGFALDRVKQRLYMTSAFVTADKFAAVSGFHFTGTDGFSLTALPGSPYYTHSLRGPFGLALDTAHHFLYVSNFDGTTISGYQINPQGGLKELRSSPFQSGSTTPTQLALDAADGFLYVPHEDGGTVFGFQVNATTGALTPLPDSYAIGAAALAVIDAVHHLLYVLANNNNLWVFQIQTNGALVATPGSPVNVGGFADTLAVAPNGTLLYLSSPSLNISTVVGYQVNTQTGELTPVPGSPFPVGLDPFGLNFDPTGTYLYSANSETVDGFQIGPSGTLTALPGSPFATGVDAAGAFTLTIP
jgi:6-phosphogluconolactonase (cycloisomerase 2 family)